MNVFSDQFVQNYHMILVTGFLFGKHDFSWLVNKLSHFYNKWPITS